MQKKRTKARYLTAAFILLSVAFFGCLNVQAKAKYTYLPQVKKNYIRDSGTSEKYELWGSDSFKRNKYGMVTKQTGKYGKHKSVCTYKYTFKNGLIKEVLQKNDGKFGARYVYTYNKKNRVTSEIQYTSKKKIACKTLYSYRNGKLKTIKYYNGTKLANTRTYTWSGNKISGYKEVYRSGKNGDVVKYTYKSGKISKATRENNSAKETFVFTGGGRLKKWTDKNKDDGYTYGFVHTYKTNKNGCVTQRTDKGTCEGWLDQKINYSSFKKYQKPKGDPVVNNYYMLRDSYEEVVQGKSHDFLCGY